MWVVPLKDRKSIAITKAFQEILDEFGHKKNKVWVGKGSEVYKRSMKSRLQDIEIEMYSTRNKGKSVVAEGFIRTLKNKIYNYMAPISKCSNAYHSTIKMKPIDVKSSTYIDFNKENNKKDPKLKVGDHVRITKYKEGYVLNWSGEVFVIKKIENTTQWAYVTKNLNGEEFVRTF